MRQFHENLYYAIRFNLGSNEICVHIAIRYKCNPTTHSYVTDGME